MYPRLCIHTVYYLQMLSQSCSACIFVAVLPSADEPDEYVILMSGEAGAFKLRVYGVFLRKCHKRPGIFPFISLIIRPSAAKESPYICMSLNLRSSYIAISSIAGKAGFFLTMRMASYREMHCD